MNRVKVLRDHGVDYEYDYRENTVYVRDPSLSRKLEETLQVALVIGHLMFKKGENVLEKRFRENRDAFNNLRIMVPRVLPDYNPIFSHNPIPLLIFTHPHFMYVPRSRLYHSFPKICITDKCINPSSIVVDQAMAYLYIKMHSRELYDDDIKLLRVMVKNILHGVRYKKPEFIFVAEIPRSIAVIKYTDKYGARTSASDPVVLELLGQVDKETIRLRIRNIIFTPTLVEETRGHITVSLSVEPAEHGDINKIIEYIHKALKDPVTKEWKIIYKALYTLINELAE